MCVSVRVRGRDEENTDKPSGFAMWLRISMKRREKSSPVPLLACEPDYSEGEREHKLASRSLLNPTVLGRDAGGLDVN